MITFSRPLSFYLPWGLIPVGQYLLPDHFIDKICPIVLIFEKNDYFCGWKE